MTMAPQRRFVILNNDNKTELKNFNNKKHICSEDIKKHLNLKIHPSSKNASRRSLEPFGDNNHANDAFPSRNRPPRVPALPALPTAVSPTLPIDAVNRKHDRKLQQQRADLLLSRVRLLNQCDGQLKNYFQKCRCRWCRHVTGASSCTWCTRHLAAFNANKFPLKEDLVVLSGEGRVMGGVGGFGDCGGNSEGLFVDEEAVDENVDCGGIVKGVFPCQIVKRRGIIPEAESSDAFDSAEPVKGSTEERQNSEVEQQQQQRGRRKASSGYGSMSVGENGVGGGEEEVEDDSPPIYFTAGPEEEEDDSAEETTAVATNNGRGAKDTATTTISVDFDCDNLNNVDDKAEEDEEEAFEKLLLTYEMIDLSELYLPSELTETSPKASSAHLTTPSTPTRSSPACNNARNNRNNNNNNCSQYRRSASASTLTSPKKSGSSSPRSRRQRRLRSRSKLSPRDSSSSSSTMGRAVVDSPSALNDDDDQNRIPSNGSSDSLVNNRHAFNRSPTDRRKRFLLLGAEGVGKSALATQLTRQGFEPRHRPSFIDFVIKEDFKVDGKTFEVQLSDSKGYEEQLSLWPENFLSLLDGIVIVYSLDKEDSLAMAESLIRQLDARGFPFVPKFLVANKNDIVSHERKLSAEDGQRKAKALDVPFLETTAIGTDSVIVTFREIIRHCERDQRRVRTTSKEENARKLSLPTTTTTRDSWFCRLKLKLQRIANDD